MPSHQPQLGELIIHGVDRLSPSTVGVDLGVKVMTTTRQPIAGREFAVYIGDEEIIRSFTDKAGSYRGRKILDIQEGIHCKAFLVLEGSVVSDADIEPMQDKPVEKKKRNRTPASTAVVHTVNRANEALEGEIGRLAEARRQVEELRRQTEALRSERVASLEEARKPSEQKKEERVVGEKIDLQDILSGRPIKAGEKVIFPKDVYEIDCDILVERGGTLVIEAGSNLQFARNTGIKSEGVLIVSGTRECPITFQAQNHQYGWCNIMLIGEGAGGSRLEYCLIYGGKGRRKYNPSTGTISKKEGEEHLRGIGGGLLILETGQSEIHLQDVNLQSNVAMNGGGMYCYRASLKMVNIRIEHNMAENEGGGVLWKDCIVEMFDSKIGSNHAAQIEDTYQWPRNGGGVCFSGGKAVLVNVVISSNTASTGGGICVFPNSSDQQSVLEMTQVILQGNGAKDSGGGMQAWNVDCTVSDSEINSNSAAGSISGSFGGLAMIKSKVLIKRTKITSNRASMVIGGVYIADCEGRIIESEIKDNTAESNAGIGVTTSNLTMDKVEISGNRASYDVGGCSIESVSVRMSGVVIKNNHASGIMAGGDMRQYTELLTGGIKCPASLYLGGCTVSGNRPSDVKHY